jgi:hypothetical protein
MKKCDVLQMSPDFTILGLDSMLSIVFKLVKIRQALHEIQVLAENRTAQLPFPDFSKAFASMVDKAWQRMHRSCVYTQ